MCKARFRAFLNEKLKHGCAQAQIGRGQLQFATLLFSCRCRRVSAPSNLRNSLASYRTSLHGFSSSSALPRATADSAGCERDLLIGELDFFMKKPAHLLRPVVTRCTNGEADAGPFPSVHLHTRWNSRAGQNNRAHGSQLLKPTAEHPSRAARF